MTRQTLLAALTILTVASLAAVGTFATFSDSEEEVGDILQAGSLDLQLGDSLPYPGASYPYEPDEDYGADPLGDSVENTWDYEIGYPGGMRPGDTLTSRVKMRNTGSIAGTSLDIICSNNNTAPEGGPLDKDTKMIITDLMYYNSTAINLLTNSDPLRRIEDVDNDGKITLDDWENDPIIGLPPPALGSQAFLDMTVLFDPNTPFQTVGTPGSYQGAGTDMTLIFSLNQ